MANEATALIDSAIVFSSDFGFYLMRLKSTDLAGDTPSSLETARRLLYLYNDEAERAENGNTTLGPKTVALRKRQIDEVEAILQKVSSEGRAPYTDIDIIQATITDLRMRLALL